MTISIVDHCPILKAGLKKIIEGEFANIDFQDYSSLEEMIASHTDPNLLIITLQTTYHTPADFKEYYTPIMRTYNTLVLSSSQDYREFQKMMTLNIKGYLRINAEPKELIYAIKSILKGMVVIDSSFLSNSMITQKEKLIQELTPREYEVFELIGKGLTNTEISLLLFISVNTVKKHVNRIIRKLGVHDRIQVLLISKDNT